ncbi:peptidase C39 family protein [Spirochaetota bacterium]
MADLTIMKESTARLHCTKVPTRFASTVWSILLVSAMLIMASCVTSPVKAPGVAPQALGRLSYRLDFSEAPLDVNAEGLSITEGSLRLIPGTTSGVYESPIFTVPGFDWLVPSLDARASGEARVALAIQVRVDGAWSEWLSFGVWGDEAKSAAKQSNAQGRVDIDTLLLYKAANGLRFRLELTASEDRGDLPLVYSVTWVARDRFAPPVAEPATYPETSIAMPPRSQMVEDPAIAGKICSPTSLSMVLESLGSSMPTAEVAWLAYDAGAGIFGNWSFNVARASALGHPAHVDYLGSIGELAAELTKGKPVIASVKYERGAIDGAAIESTSGHLLVVRGLARRGEQWYVLVNDPAAADVAGVPREYLASQFKNAWTGVVYLFD